MEVSGVEYGELVDWQVVYLRPRTADWRRNHTNIRITTTSPDTTDKTRFDFVLLRTSIF